VVDIISTEARSRLMSRICSKNTGPEIVLRSGLHALGYRFRLHVRALPGTPDIVLPRFSTAIEVRGCFFHRHSNCKLAYTPKSNRKSWRKKFEANVKRDARSAKMLLSLGWRLLVVWECQLRGEQSLKSTVSKTNDWIRSGARVGELPSRS
jgi:DNA mismatch endonuclease (patch repair protein)